MDYHVYLLECADGTYYTGICTDIERRISEHNGNLKGARYTRARQPVTLAYSETQPDRSSAQKREYALRKLSHQAKHLLIKNAPVQTN